MKTPPKASVQKVCRTKGSGSSLPETPTCHCCPRDSAFPALLQQGAGQRDGCQGEAGLKTGQQVGWGGGGSIPPTIASSQVLKTS